MGAVVRLNIFYIAKITSLSWGSLSDTVVPPPPIQRPPLCQSETVTYDGMGGRFQWGCENDIDSKWVDLIIVRYAPFSLDDYMS